MKHALCKIFAALLFSVPTTVLWAADPLQLTSPAFKDDDLWPSKYACDVPGPSHVGENISPPVAWSNPPANTKSFALIMKDPDGGLGVGSFHWIAYDIPPSVNSIPEGAGSVSPTGWVGGNLGNTDHYRGPCAPLGQGIHHYVINIIATDIPPGTLKAGLTRDELMQAIHGHALGTASLIARYQRN
jgi:Raf kinase inhibitor-like YbhB/YbcL family protein